MPQLINPYHAIKYTVSDPKGIKAKGDSDPVIIIDKKA